MIITCEECSTSFNLDEKFLKPSGSKVRCSKC
ncbi:MAG: zinc-ribbon domain-containing protein, partial [Deltaproteobacteria bacterium]|nr:zinc-ribbon domain-containing protein [Deltaproteobacteria bacterium]